MRVGVLALQGDVKEHVSILEKLNAEPLKVKTKEDLEDLDALIIPGGESTTLGMLIKRYGMERKIKEKNREGMPIYGTCAGAILLAREITGSKQPNLGILDITVDRNSYGRQLDSFETELSVKELGNLKGIFIRAPRIKRLHNGAQVLAEHNNCPVMLRQDNILITTFHPELAKDERIHKYFLDMVEEYKEVRDMQRDIEGTKSEKLGIL